MADDVEVEEVEEEDAEAPAKRIRGTTHFGWCMVPNQHELCPGVSVSGRRCGCPHHDKDKKDDDAQDS